MSKKMEKSSEIREREKRRGYQLKNTIYKVRSKINETFVIKKFLVAPSVNEVVQRANIKFCFKIGKTFTETFELMKKVYGDDCLSRARVHDEHTDSPKSVITENSIEIVREFIKNEPKSSLKSMESEFNISKTSIYRILTDHLGLRKVCERFIPHKLNATSHRSTLVTDFLTRNRILTINHSPYSPDMAPCDFYLFGKLHLAMKGKRFASVEAIQKACTDILKDIPVNDLKHSFEKLLDRAFF